MTRRRALICSAVFLLALIVTAIGGAVRRPPRPP